MSKTGLSALIICSALLCSPLLMAAGEAGILTLRAQGHFYVGSVVSAPAENGAVSISNQMYVGYQLPAEKQHPYPLILVHGGGGQAIEWDSTPDGRDGWKEYFLAAGFDVYVIDRPGYGRSPTNRSYGEPGDSPTSQIITFLANSRHWPGNPLDHHDPAILAWLAGSQPGPYGGDQLAAHDLGLLLDKVGPAILVTYSAGGLSGWWALDQNPAKVAGVIAVEPGASNITTLMRTGLTFQPPLTTDFEPQKDAEGCYMQSPETPSKLPNFIGKPIHLIGSEMGLVAGLTCAVKAFKQAGVKVDYTYLPDLGFKGNGHLMMAELNNGDLAQVLIRIAADIK